MATRWHAVTGKAIRRRVCAEHFSPHAAVEDYSFTTQAVRDVLAVLQLAQTIEPDPWRLMHWYRHTAIAELDGLTAEKLVCLGRTDEVMRFLRSICLGARH